MGFTIDSVEDERLFRAYTEYRDTVRRIMGGGVYPKLNEAIAAYDAFDDALATTLADPDLLAYHEELMEDVEPYTAQLRTAASSIVTMMVAIETAQPGTFDIPLL